MAEKISGKLDALSKNDYGFYRFKIGGTWYSGTKKEPKGIAQGDYVEAEFYLKDDKYKTLVDGSLVKGKSEGTKAPAGASSGGTSGSAGMSKAEWAAKDDAIRYQSSRKDALAFLALPGVLDAAGVAKAKPADKIGIIEGLVDKYTAGYFEDVATFGAVARANGAGTEDQAAPPNEEDDE